MRVRVRVDSTSLMSSSPSPRAHCEAKGPDMAEENVRGWPRESRLRTGTDAAERSEEDKSGGAQWLRKGSEEGRREMNARAREVEVRDEGRRRRDRGRRLRDEQSRGEKGGGRGDTR